MIVSYNICIVNTLFPFFGNFRRTGVGADQMGMKNFLRSFVTEKRIFQRNFCSRY